MIFAWLICYDGMSGVWWWFEGRNEFAFSPLSMSEPTTLLPATWLSPSLSKWSAPLPRINRISLVHGGSLMRLVGTISDWCHTLLHTACISQPVFASNVFAPRALAVFLVTMVGGLGLFLKPAGQPRGLLMECYSCIEKGTDKLAVTIKPFSSNPGL
ncbi:hypothetical protein HAX54_027972 [Datura stramonium]|uniref:Uncharacterized protein n=1 Tax=Datura stramonium TaxID=4076 RepID=A0ABS8V5M0_DATST|nr:hypothetical protein [Datura stramonium]